MASVKLYLDVRFRKKKKDQDGGKSKKEDDKYPIKIVIRHKRAAVHLSTGYSIPLNYWNKKEEFIKAKCPGISSTERTNIHLQTMCAEYKEGIEVLHRNNQLEGLTVKQLVDKLTDKKEKQKLTFTEYIAEYSKTINNKSTRKKYDTTLIAINKYQDGQPLLFKDISVPWLNRFKEYRLSKVDSPNTVNIDLRNIRAVMNRAIDVDEIISPNLYPFRNFEFAKTTPRNLRLDVETIKKIRDFETDSNVVALARDFFMLSFYLIGMNNFDIYGITGITKDGRVEYIRGKTGKEYTIKLEPEAKAIIDKYRGKKAFLYYSERYKSVDTLNKQINLHLKIIGGYKDIGVPKLIMYHARHSWAGLAAKKPVKASKYEIATALGHGKKTVTDVYFDYDTDITDDLNRKVLDLLL